MTYLQGDVGEGAHLRARFNTQWLSRTDIAWPNVNFKPPSHASWVRFRISHASARLASIGTNPMHRYDGTVTIEVFTPPGTGDGTMDSLCDAAALIFKDYRTQQGLRFDTPYAVDLGQTAEGWYKRDVLCPFRRDTIYSLPTLYTPGTEVVASRTGSASYLDN